VGGHGVANAGEVALQLGHRSKVGCSAIHQEVQPVKEPKHLAEPKSLRLTRPLATQAKSNQKISVAA
jgi:hypothetical protein